MSEYLNEQQKRYLDIDTALSRVRGSTTLFCKLLKMYLVSEEFDAFENHITSGDLTAACNSIHSIKGLSGNLSLIALFEISSKLNQQLKEGSPNENDLSEYREIVVKTKEVVLEFLAQAS